MFFYYYYSDHPRSVLLKKINKKETEHFVCDVSLWIMTQSLCVHVKQDPLPRWGCQHYLIWL